MGPGVRSEATLWVVVPHERNNERWRHHVLLIDDDVELCELLAQYLETEGFDIDAVYDGLCGVEQALTGQHALVVLDVMLPGMGRSTSCVGFGDHPRIPVLMLTARGEAIDRILGLELGADDYLPKPFDPRELAARIRAILRRTLPPRGALPVATPLHLGDLALDTGARVVHRGREGPSSRQLSRICWRCCADGWPRGHARDISPRRSGAGVLAV